MATELTQSLTHINPQQPIPHDSSNPTTMNLSSATAEEFGKSDSAATKIHLTNAAPQPSNSATSKMSLRPRKIRKLSPQPSSTTAEETLKPTSAVKTTTAKKKSIRSKPEPSPPRFPARLLSHAGEVDAALLHFEESDPMLSEFIDNYPQPKFKNLHSPFISLIRSILYQKLFFMKETSIYARFVSLCGGENGVVPETVLSLTPEQLRQIGICEEKSSYLHDLAKMYQDGALSDSAILDMDDESLIATLSTVKGIGSVHMFMIFSLHRPDVLPIRDLGFRTGYRIFNLDEKLPPPSAKRLCEEWRPYRSVGAWYMWLFAGREKSSREVAAALAAGAGLVYSEEQMPRLWNRDLELFDFRSVRARLKRQ